MRFDVPTIDNESKPWWDAAAEHRLLVKKCNACGHTYWYPRDFCPECWSEDTAWVEASGRGTLYTFSTVNSNDLPPWNTRVPYIAAIVDLEEGPRMMALIIDAEESDLKIGMDLTVDFRDDEDGEFTLPVFRPAA